MVCHGLDLVVPDRGEMCSIQLYVSHNDLVQSDKRSHSGDIFQLSWS
jgi:hypothetical protein